MHYLPISGIPMIEEPEAEGELAELYEATKHTLEMPFVPNIAKALAAAPNVLATVNECYGSFFNHISLFSDTLADALKIEVDEVVAQALAG